MHQADRISPEIAQDMRMTSPKYVPREWMLVEAKGMKWSRGDCDEVAEGLRTQLRSAKMLQYKVDVEGRGYPKGYGLVQTLCEKINLTEERH